jgi:hypothetical protein
MEPGGELPLSLDFRSNFFLGLIQPPVTFLNVLPKSLEQRPFFCRFGKG